MVTTRSSKPSASQSANQPDSDQPKIDQALGGKGEEKITKGKKRGADKEEGNEVADKGQEESGKDEVKDDGHAEKKRKVAAKQQDTKDTKANPIENQKNEKSDIKADGPASAEPIDKTDVTAAEKDLSKHADVLEYGRIHFLYKPRVEVMHPSSISEVQRLHIILQPHDKKHPETFEEDGQKERAPVLSRLIGVGRKVLPDAEKKAEGAPPPPQSTGGQGRGNNLGRSGRQPFWGFVSDVSEDIADLHERLGESKNDTKTKGTRTTGADRLIASGPYCILSHASTKSGEAASKTAEGKGDPPSQRDTLLVYSLTLPHEMGEVQKAFNLKKEGAFRISVKNPKINAPVPGGARSGLKEKAEFPEELQSAMGDLRWHPLTPPTFLDHKHAELLFIATHASDLPDIAGDEILHDMEDIADEGDLEHLSGHAEEQAEAAIKAEIFDMLKAREDKNIVVGGDAIVTGEWE